MKLIEDQNVMHIVRSVLDAMDTRLIAHGERVAYLVWNIMKYERRLPKEIRIASELALIHDIGAFKTDEIDVMLSFDSDLAWSHSIYGYTFLKYLSPLENFADCILYHHIPYSQLKKVACSHPYITSLIHLCDRIDVLSHAKGGFQMSMLERFQDGEFDEKRIHSFMELEKQEQIIEKLYDGTFMEANEEYFKTFHFSEETKVKYLEMLAYSIDFNSEHMVLHTIMTVALSVEIAKMMKLSEEIVEKIKYGSLLHDIGKVKIPITILEKEGALSVTEMETMRKHILYSEEILQNYLPEDIFHIAVRHHEKLNGRGYPHQLTEADLTLPERIVAIGDVTSALLGKRSYKESYSSEKTLMILQEMVDQHELDGNVVAFFETHQEELLTRARTSANHIYLLYAKMLDEYRTLSQKVVQQVG